MTRDKAIEEVKNYENYPNGLSKECRDYIVKALEQVPSSLENPNLSENPISSTTKTCETCRYGGSYHKLCHYCYKCSLWIEKITKKCITCAYREVDGKPHEICKSCVCGDRYREDSTTKNLPHCQLTDEEIAKSFIEDVEAVKEQLPCGEQMDFPDTFDEFAKDYGFKDEKKIYTNGSELIPVFRVKQWLEHINERGEL